VAGQSSNGQWVGLDWDGQRRCNSLKAQNRDRWQDCFVFDPRGVGVWAEVKRREEEYKTQAGCRWNLEDFQIQDKIQDNLDEIFGAAWDDPLLSLFAYPQQTGKKNRTWWIPCRKPLRLPFFFGFVSRCLVHRSKSDLRLSGPGLAEDCRWALALANETSADRQPSTLGADAC